MAAFTLTGPLATGRASHTTMGLPDGRVLIVGGFSAVDMETGETTLAPMAEVYDPASGTFSSTGSLVVPRSGHGATLLLDGHVLVVGGGRVSGRPFPQVLEFLSSAELFDPAAGTFAAAPGSLTTERSVPSVTVLPDGRVLFAGDPNAFGDPLSAELFDPGDGTFSPAGMAESTHGFGVAPLLAAAEMLDPAALGLAAPVGAG